MLKTIIIGLALCCALAAADVQDGDPPIPTRTRDQRPSRSEAAPLIAERPSAPPALTPAQKYEFYQHAFAIRNQTATAFELEAEALKMRQKAAAAGKAFNEWAAKISGGLPCRVQLGEDGEPAWACQER